MRPELARRPPDRSTPEGREQARREGKRRTRVMVAQMQRERRLEHRPGIPATKRTGA